MTGGETVTSLREAARAKLVHARAVLETLERQVQPQPTAIEWQKGYMKALEEMLDWEGLSRRRHPRRRTAVPTEIARMVPKKEATGEIVDLSVGGCHFVTALDLSVGDIIELSFRLPKRSTIVTLEGLVRRAQRVDEEHRVGVEFIELPEDIAEALGAFLAAF